VGSSSQRPTAASRRPHDRERPAHIGRPRRARRAGPDNSRGTQHVNADDPTEPDSDPDSWSAGLDGYDRLTFVGRGGTATVYSATRTADGSLVAVKVFDAPESGPFDRQMRA